jgi:pSer/pThr/pTyr-binding forkhead associated (FHA) protein
MSMWILEHRGPSRGEALTFRMLPGSIKTVGRATRADFVVDAAMVSRFHCRLTATPAGTLEVEDLQSTNGTFVNDRRISRLALAEGDRLRVGRVELTVRRGSDWGLTPSQDRAEGV